MSLNHNLVYVALPLLLLSVSNIMMIFAYGRLQKTVIGLQCWLASEKAVMQMLIDSDAISLASPSKQKCQ